MLSLVEPMPIPEATINGNEKSADNMLKTSMEITLKTMKRMFTYFHKMFSILFGHFSKNSYMQFDGLWAPIKPTPPAIPKTSPVQIPKPPL